MYGKDRLERVRCSALCLCGIWRSSFYIRGPILLVRYAPDREPFSQWRFAYSGKARIVAYV